MNGEASLLWGLVFSSVGLAYFVYGKRQGRVVPLVCGVALMVYPYVVANTLLVVGIGAVLSAVPFFVAL